MASPAQSSHEAEEVDPAPLTPEENETTQQNDDPETMNRDDPGYEFEVKEQDRWLPIANGE